MFKKSMPPPYFPQMSDDGIITDDDLTDDIIYAEIRPYAHAETGDAIFFYLDGLLHQFSEVTDATTWPIIYKIPAGDVPDGVYPCYYKVRDKADNVSVSATQYCIIFRGVDSILPPPVFSDAVEGVITAQNILAVAGTHVAVPAYPGIAVDDVVTLTTLVNGASDFPPESQYTAQHTVTSDDLSGGFSLLVPERVLIVTASGTAYARYTVHSATRNALSESASASIENSTDTLLPAPWLPDAPADVLTGADVIAHSGVRAALSYPDMRVGDVVLVTLRGLAISGVPVTEPENQVCVVSAAQVAAGEAEVLFSQQIPSSVRDGFLDCYYHVARDGITRLSMIDHVQLVSDIDETLPAPVFLSAEGGVLYTDTVQAENGTPLLIAYDTMMTGDYVRVLLRGWDAAGQVVPEAEYVTSHTITAPEAAAHQYTEFLPAAPLLAVGDNGRLQAAYVVYNNGLSILSRSYTENILMEYRTISTQLGGCTGYIPWNGGVIQGAYVKYLMIEGGKPIPSMDISFDIEGGNYFYSNGGSHILAQTDENGIAEVHISGSDVSMNIINAKIANDPGAITSSLGFEVQKQADYTEPLLTLEPAIMDEHNLILSCNAGDAVFNIFINNDGRIIVDGEDVGTEIFDVNVFSSTPFRFGVKALNTNTELKVTSKDSLKEYCKILFI